MLGKGWYVQEGVVSDTQIFVVDHFVLDLGLGGGHHVSDSGLGVLVVEGLHVGHLHVGDFPVKSGRDGPELSIKNVTS